MTVVYVVAGVVAFLLLWFAFSYNAFVTQRNLVRESWSDVDTELKRRHDLIPNIVETVKGYAKHEREIFERVSELRAQAIASDGAPERRARAEGALAAGVRQLLAVSERYPDLRASENFLALQRELANTEDRIQAARRFYNANVRDLNRRVQSVPSNLVASMFGFKAAAYFEAGESERATPRVDAAP
jgi:LemA protein